MQRGRDSNPRYTFGVYTLSRRAPSTTRPALRGAEFTIASAPVRKVMALKRGAYLNTEMIFFGRLRPVEVKVKRLCIRRLGVPPIG